MNFHHVDRSRTRIFRRYTHTLLRHSSIFLSTVISALILTSWFESVCGLTIIAQLIWELLFILPLWFGRFHSLKSNLSLSAWSVQLPQLKTFLPNVSLRWLHHLETFSWFYCIWHLLFRTTRPCFCLTSSSSALHSCRELCRVQGSYAEEKAAWCSL